MVLTDDPAFASQSVSFEVVLTQDIISDPVTLKVTVDFEIDPPAFDLDGFTASPLTCDKDVAEWSLLLPPVANAEASSVTIELAATESSQYFELKGDTISFLAEQLDKFLADMCAEDGELKIEVIIRSEEAGDN